MIFLYIFYFLFFFFHLPQTGLLNLSVGTVDNSLLNYVENGDGAASRIVSSNSLLLGNKVGSSGACILIEDNNDRNIGYIFDGMESVCNGQRNFQCTINSGNYGVSSVKLDSYFVKSVPLVPVVSSSVLTLTAPKRRYHGDIRSCSVSK